MNRSWWIGLGLLVAIALSAACLGLSGSSEDPEAVELRTYTVPEGFDRNEWYSVLNNTLITGDTRIGNVTPGPSNTLVVTAPRSVHDGIEDLLEELKSRGPEPRPEPGSVSVNYWVLVSRPIATGGSVSPVRIASDQKDRLGRIEPVLDQIVSVQGPMEFHLLEQLQLTSVDTHEHSEIRGRSVEISQTVMSPMPGERIADVKIRMFGKRGTIHNLASRIKLERDKYVVLGQTAYNGEKPGLFGQTGQLDDDMMLYYVVAAEAD